MENSDDGHSCLSAGRRCFLNAGLILGATRIDPALCATLSRAIGTDEARSVGRRGPLVDIRRTVEEIGGADAYYRLRDKLAANAICPWVRLWIEALGDSVPRGIEATVEMIHENGAMTIGPVVHYGEWDEPEDDIAVSLDKLTFGQWLHEFRPEGRDDFVMAQSLYSFYLYQGSGEIFPKIQVTPDPWLDAMLKSTRGLLFWRPQWIELCRMVGNLGPDESWRLYRDYACRRPNASGALDQIRYLATDQSLMQIFEERCPGLGLRGWPDYVTGDWLHQYWMGCER